MSFSMEDQFNNLQTRLKIAFEKECQYSCSITFYDAFINSVSKEKRIISQYDKVRSEIHKFQLMIRVLSMHGSISSKDFTENFQFSRNSNSRIECIDKLPTVEEQIKKVSESEHM